MGFFSGFFGGIVRQAGGVVKSFGRAIKNKLTGGTKGKLVTRGGVEDETFYSYEDILESERRAARPVIRKANAQYKEVKATGYLSTAIDYADSTGGLFNVEDKFTVEEVIAELTRAETFLNDETSTTKGALAYDVMIHTKEQEIQGGAYTEGDSEMWAAFRMLEEMNPTGVAIYGSDNLINALYNAMEHGHEPLSWGIDALNAQYEARQNEWTSAVGSVPFIW